MIGIGARPPPACHPPACDGITGGHGIVANIGGRISFTRFVIDDAALCGLVVSEPHTMTGAESAIDLSDGVVRRAPVGACVQSETFDSSRLQHGVTYEEVGVPLSATHHELPAGP